MRQEKVMVRITDWPGAPVAAPPGGRVFTVHHLGGDRYFSAPVDAATLADAAAAERAWAMLEEHARQAQAEAGACRHCGDPQRHPGLPGCPDVPLRPVGERSTRKVRPRPQKAAGLNYDRFQLLVDATHGVLFRDGKGAVWRDENLAPHWYLSPGRGPQRRHVTGAVQALERMGWLVPDPEGVMRVSVFAAEMLANTVR